MLKFSKKLRIFAIIIVGAYLMIQLPLFGAFEASRVNVTAKIDPCDEEEWSQGDVFIDNENDAEVKMNVETVTNSGGNEADGGEIATGSAVSSAVVVNMININKTEIHGCDHRCGCKKKEEKDASHNHNGHNHDGQDDDADEEEDYTQDNDNDNRAGDNNTETESETVLDEIDSERDNSIDSRIQPNDQLRETINEMFGGIGTWPDTHTLATSTQTEMQNLSSETAETQVPDGMTPREPRNEGSVSERTLVLPAASNLSENVNSADPNQGAPTTLSDGELVLTVDSNLAIDHEPVNEQSQTATDLAEISSGNVN